jgi:predicted transcriptional regulator
VPISPNQSKRGEQLNALRKLQLPNWSDVRPGVAKAVLRAVDGYGAQCWASIQTLSAETQFSPRAVQRSLSHLVDIGYLSTNKRVGQTSTFSVQWDKLTHVSLTGVGDIDPRQSDTPPTSDRHPTHVSLTGDPRQTDTLYVKETKKETKKKRNTRADKSAESETKLQEWIAFWNRLASEKLVNASTSTTPNKGVVKSWKRVQQSSELQKLLSDRAAIETAITNGEFVRGSWFTLPKLFGGTNKDGEYIIQKLLDGGYISNSSSKPTIANVGAGVQFNPERKTKW